jgi:hypothetical protein
MGGFRVGRDGTGAAGVAQLRNQILSRSQVALQAVGLELKTEVSRTLSSPGSGRYYAKTARTAGVMPTGPRNAAERVALARRHLRNKRLNGQRRAAAEGLNAGRLSIADIRSRRTLTGLHRASAPGEAPAPDSGTLRRSAFIERTATGVRVGVAMPYARALEFGASGAGRFRRTTILPRPFMRPARAAAESRMGTIFVSTMRGGR